MGLENGSRMREGNAERFPSLLAAYSCPANSQKQRLDHLPALWMKDGNVWACVIVLEYTSFFLGQESQ
jgi:hypothetical protein